MLGAFFSGVFKNQIAVSIRTNQRAKIISAVFDLDSEQFVDEGVERKGHECSDRSRPGASEGRESFFGGVCWELVGCVGGSWRLVGELGGSYGGRERGGTGEQGRKLKKPG